MEFNELTEEQKAKARECKTPEDIINLAKKEGYRLSDDELEVIYAGKDWGRGCFAVGCKNDES